MSSKDTDGEHVMHSKSDNIEIMTYKVDEVIKEIFESILYRYETGLKKSVKGSDFVFDYVNFLYYKCHKINLKCVGSYMDYPDRISIKIALTNPVNDDDRCFQYSAKIELNHKEMRKYSKRVSKIKHSIYEYNCKGMNHPSRKDTWKQMRKMIQQLLLMYYVLKEKMYIAYVSKHNSIREK